MAHISTRSLEHNKSRRKPDLDLLPPKCAEVNIRFFQTPLNLTLRLESRGRLSLGPGVGNSESELSVCPSLDPPAVTYSRARVQESNKGRSCDEVQAFKLAAHSNECPSAHSSLKLVIISVLL